MPHRNELTRSTLLGILVIPRRPLFFPTGFFRGDSIITHASGGAYLRYGQPLAMIPLLLPRVELVCHR